MPVVRKLSKEQELAKNKYDAVETLARKAGFDEQMLADAEFSLIPFFNSIIEECAKVAELQSRNYDGSGNEAAGCAGAATAVRRLGRMIGNE